jgi:hypothetical protein
MRTAILWLTLLGAGPPADADDPTDPAERRAAAAVADLGGRVRTDRRDPARPVVVVDLNGVQIDDADLKRLAAFTKLRELVVGGSLKVTDAGLAHVKGLDTLEELVLSHTRVTDAGLRDLAGMKRLRKLVLDSTAVTDAGLKELERLTTLRLLYVGDTKVTPDGVAALKKANPAARVFR